MKVLHILNEINHSGAELMIHSSYPLFEKKDIIFTALSTGKTPGTFASEFVKAGIFVVHKPLVKNLNLPFIFLPYFWSFYKYLKAEKFDVVHIHRMYLYFWFALASKLAGTKVVVRTVHNVFKPTYRYPQYYLSRKILHRLNVKFISIGKSVEKHELDFFNNDTIRVNNWYNTNKFFPIQADESKSNLRNRLGIPLDAFVVISIGSCHKMKNHEHIINALKVLLDKYPKLYYLHLGDGTNCSSEKQLTQSLGINDRCMFVGNVENVRDFIISSDIYIMPSDFEGLPISLIEVMACEMPAIGYDVTGIRDLIEHNINGHLIPNSIDKLSNSIEELMNSPEKCHTFSKNSLKLVNNEYNIKKAVGELISIYQNKTN